MKVGSSVRTQCEHCRIIRRKGVLFCVCSDDPRHKARQSTKSKLKKSKK